MNHSSSKRVRFVKDDDPAANRTPPRRMIRGYRDDDFDRYRREPLDYDEFEIRSPHIDRRQRDNSEDGYNLIVHGSDPNGRSKKKIDAPYAREEPLEGLETLDRAHRDKELEIQRLPQNRKRAADAFESRQSSAKKPRTSKGSRSDRLCLDCEIFLDLAHAYTIAQIYFSVSDQQAEEKRQPRQQDLSSLSRLEEEDAKQSQSTVDEEIKQREQRMIDINNQMASSTLSLRRSSAPSPGHESGPDTKSKAIRLKKNTRFSRRELQSRLATFDRGYGVSQQKRAVSPQQAEHVIDHNRVHPLAPVNTKAIPNFNFERNGTMSSPLNSNKTFYYRAPSPDASASRFASSAQEQHDRQQYDNPARFIPHALRSGSLKTTDSLVQPSTEHALGEGAIVPASAPVAASNVAIPGLSIAQSVEALIAETAQAIHDDDANASETDGDTPAPVDGVQSPPSYLEYLRRNGAE
ncbi:hypothetical protein E4T43_03415 [Aureobasidium subglaciale]|nr:hypothetical protein E4T43_03415 [Aureobasidium subglaciale]